MKPGSLLVYGAIAVVTLAAAELGARAITWSAPFSSDSVGDRMGTERYSFNFDGPGDLMPGQDGHWMIWWRRPYHVETKSQGFRSAEVGCAGLAGDMRGGGGWVGEGTKQCTPDSAFPLPSPFKPTRPGVPEGNTRVERKGVG